MTFRLLVLAGCEQSGIHWGSNVIGGIQWEKRDTIPIKCPWNPHFCWVDWLDPHSIEHWQNHFQTFFFWFTEFNLPSFLPKNLVNAWCFPMTSPGLTVLSDSSHDATTSHAWLGDLFAPWAAGCHRMGWYTRPGKHTKSYWKWSFIVDFPTKNGDFP